jgi:CRP/FNR family cyclic AMP-dependent transcriptional regulator
VSKNCSTNGLGIASTDKAFGPFVSCLTDDERVIFEKNCSAVEFAAGATIIERHNNDSSVFFVLSGTVSVLNYTTSGRAITHATLCSGNIFGEMAAIDCGPRAAWVLAVDDCKLLKIPGKIFINLAERNHKFSFELLRKLSANLREANDRALDFFSLDAEQRACLELVRMAKPDPLRPNSYLVNQMPTQANFATLIGSSRETVSRIMSRLKNESVINISARGLEILDKKQLEKRAFG